MAFSRMIYKRDDGTLKVKVKTRIRNAAGNPLGIKVKTHIRNATTAPLSVTVTTSIRNY